MTHRIQKLLCCTLLLLSLFPFTLSAQTAESAFNALSIASQQRLSVGGAQGVAAPFAGISGEALLVAGGCNFPDTPAAEGGEKVFYPTVFAKDRFATADEAWREVGTLPQALAYGASVTVPQGVICLGGTPDGKTSLADAFIMRYTDGKLAFEPLPPMPVALDNFAAAASPDGYIYVAGGQTDGAVNRKAFRLKYADATAQWEQLPDMPGAGRVQPAAAVQNDALGSCFYLLGGFDPEGKHTVGNALVYNPRSGQWRETSPMRVAGDTGDRCLVGASAVSSGCAHILCIGGVNAEIFNEAINQPAPDYLTHEAAWYRFNRQILIYHTVTDSWSVRFDDEALARAGAAVIPCKNPSSKTGWMVVGGESKPGIRSADVTQAQITYDAHFGALNWSVLVIYLLGMLFLGYYFMRREANSDDFFKGGGRIPWWAAGISIFATMLSAITYMSIPAKAYATDWTYYPMQVLILLVAFPVITYYLPFFRRLNVTSAYEYLERRFNYATRLMASVLFIVFMVARMALVLFLPSLAMTAVTGIDIYFCIILMALVTIVYCTMGGMEAVVWGDVVQGIILIGGAFLAAGYLIFNTEGGASGFFDMALADDKFRFFDWSFDYRNATFWVVILGGIGNNLISYTADQTVIQRYLTTKDERSAGRSILTNGLMSVFVTIAFFAIGTGLYTFFKSHPEALDLTMAKGDAIFPFFMMSQLPAGIAGLLIAAIFAATMSTISSNINSISTAFTIDLYKKARPQATDRQTLRTARWTGILAGMIGMGIALLMATVDIQSLLDYFNTIIGLLSGGVGALFLMGIFFPRIGSRAALTGFACGMAVVFWLHFFTPVNFLLFGFVSMAVGVLVALACSFVWPAGGKSQAGLTWRTLNDKP